MEMDQDLLSYLEQKYVFPRNPEPDRPPDNIIVFRRDGTITKAERPLPVGGNIHNYLYFKDRHKFHAAMAAATHKTPQVLHIRAVLGRDLIHTMAHLFLAEQEIKGGENYEIRNRRIHLNKMLPSHMRPGTLWNCLAWQEERNRSMLSVV